MFEAWISFDKALRIGQCRRVVWREHTSFGWTLCHWKSNEPNKFRNNFQFLFLKKRNLSLKLTIHQRVHDEQMKEPIRWEQTCNPISFPEGYLKIPEEVPYFGGFNWRNFKVWMLPKVQLRKKLCLAKRKPICNRSLSNSSVHCWNSCSLSRLTTKSPLSKSFTKSGHVRVSFLTQKNVLDHTLHRRKIHSSRILSLSRGNEENLREMI